MFKPEVLAQNIKMGRKKSGLTQSELAHRLFVSDRAISKWEMGNSVPEMDNLFCLADIFSTTIDKLVGHTIEPSDKKAFIGIDGGATKTEFVMFAEDGQIIRRLCFEGCNPNVCGFEKACDILKSGIDILLDLQYDVLGVFGGISGYSSGNNSKLFDKFLQTTYPLLKVTFDTDIHNVVSCEGLLSNCAVVICGTGFAIFANEKDKLSRVGAWGYLLDNIGGGFGIGREALRVALAQRDGFGKETIITELVEQKLGDKVWNCLNTIYKEGDSFIASFAPVVFDAYKQGDSIASDILDSYVLKMKELLDFTLSHYDCNNRIILSGGLMSDGILIKLLKNKMGKNIKITVPKTPQICGACYKCCKLYGTPSAGFLDEFVRSYKQLGATCI